MCTHNCRQGRACREPCPTEPLQGIDDPPLWLLFAVILVFVMTAAFLAGYYTH